MFDPCHAPSFRLEIAGLPEPVAVVAFIGLESLSQPFAYQVDLFLDAQQWDIASLLYQGAYLSFGTPDEGIHGQIHELSAVPDDAQPGLWRVSLGPRLKCLAQRFSQRLFTGQTVPQILEQVLRQHGIVGPRCRFELANDYPVLALCTQYRETDLEFVQRLCDRARIHYRFDHHRRGHCLVFADTPPAASTAGGLDFEGAGTTAAVRRFQVCAELEGDEQHVRIEGESCLATLRSGQCLSVSGYPYPNGNGAWWLTRVEHRGQSLQVPPYCNRLWAIPLDQPFVSTPPCAPPRMNGVQRGWVVSVDDRHRDAAQRVAVQFDWLYQGQGAQPSHCWLPVSAGLCAQVLDGLVPGAPVCVSFIDGDPDRPLISGVLADAPGAVALDQVASVAAEASSLHLRLSAALFAGADRAIEVQGDPVQRFDADTDRHFKVGTSEARFEGGELLLSSAQIQLKAVAPVTPPVVAAPTLSPARQRELLTLIQGGEPLVLLCLIPGGGSFRHCPPAGCVCRLATGLGQSGVA
ncbi:type VI secretion system secreted protein VgrG [Pseudomonas sp. ok272]|uniref:type VI secretion system Vgr family protein n=1 Tax=unclassified Pseudomonas TaxID=196821 RepID=UPI0008B90106|nr:MULTISPECIES: contractile injection system protein, VgrG/Pvc8 family [unclassified Pseudomonas]SEM89227.1 type VI secretion system secreted protein VgrG [Pseudomonas sp. ok272]SFM74079.1 type VI secretion system secreted protein VgrG [Pseudomonas sp. ok602]